MHRASLQESSLLHRLRQGHETLQRVWVFGNSCRLKRSHIAEQKLKVSFSRSISSRVYTRGKPTCTYDVAHWYAADAAHSVEVAEGWQLAQKPGSPDYFGGGICRLPPGDQHHQFFLCPRLDCHRFFSTQCWSFHQQRLGPELDTNPTKGKTHFVHALFRSASLHFLRMRNPRYTTATCNWNR